LIKVSVAIVVLSVACASGAEAQGGPRGAGYPRLLGMNIGAKNYDEPQYLDALSRLDVAILGFYPGWRGDRQGEKIGKVVGQMKARNPAMLVGQYTILNESSDDRVRSAASRDRIDKLDEEDWWLRKSDRSKTAWSREYSAFDVNFTQWSKPDRNGDRYPQWLAKRDHRMFFGPVPQFGIWYFDNVMIRSRVGRANWKLDGNELSNRDPEVEAAFRRGMAEHWDAARRLAPNVLLMGNADNDLSSPEYRGKLHGVFLEGLMGKSWSLERTAGWTGMMKRYLSVRQNLVAPAIVGFNVAGDPADTRFFRYAFCSSLMGDGYFSFTDAKAGYSSVPWFDEYETRLGKAVDPPQETAWSNGVYRRRYEHALALVNPGPSARTVTLEPGWRRMRGKQAPAVNDGSKATELTLGPADGILLVRD
jgi:hypothetical protein